MRISMMLIMICSILIIGGVGQRTFRSIGIDKRNALFFLTSIAVLSRFTLYPADEAEVSPACIAAAAWLFGYAFSEKAESRMGYLILPTAVIAGGLTLPLTRIGSEWAGYASALAAVPLSLAFGSGFAAAAAAIAPAVSCIIAFTYDMLLNGGGLHSLTEYCLMTQISGIVLAFAVKLIQPYFRTTVRTASVD